MLLSFTLILFVLFSPYIPTSPHLSLAATENYMAVDEAIIFGKKNSFALLISPRTYIMYREDSSRMSGKRFKVVLHKQLMHLHYG